MMEEEPRIVPMPTSSNSALSNLPHLTQKDPGLMITPEKFSKKSRTPQFQDVNKSSKLAPGVLITKNFYEKHATSELQPENSDLIPTKLVSLINDSTLDVTPEKPPTGLKQSRNRNQESNLVREAPEKNTRKLHVRFDVPESPIESEIADDSGEDFSLERNTGLDKLSKEPFQTRAALYVQRNPLADITSDSSFQETSENTTGTETFTSTDSDNSSLFQKIAQFIENNGSSVADMHGKVIRGESKVVQTLPQVKLKTTQKKSGKDVTKPPKITKSKIISVEPHGKQGPPRSVIDNITRPKNISALSDTTVRKQFLKKKSGLHRHEHSIRYGAQNGNEENSLSGPTYNSTLNLGQELQELKIAEFDAKNAVKNKMAESESLRNYVAEKTAEATNINPDEKLYQNLVSVQVPENEVLPTNTTWKRMKPKPFKQKKMKHGEPNIMDTFCPEDLFFEEPFIDLECKVPAPGKQQMSLEHIMSIDEHFVMWNGL